MTYLYDKALVTGGAGFIGSQLVKELLPLSRSLIVIDDCSTGARENIPDSDRIKFFEASYVDEPLLRSVLPGCSHIFHAACRNLVMSARNIVDDFNVNLYGGYLLLRMAQELCPGLQRFEIGRASCRERVL